MATSTAGATGWYRGKVKAVPSGDSLVIMAMTSSKPGPPPEKTITLSSLIAPRLARRGGVDEPFAWDSREYLRKLCIGQEVTFKVDYAVPSIGREFGSVFLGDKNVALLVVSEGWAKVREQGQQKGEASPFLAELLRLEEQAKQQGLGKWSKAPGASEAAIRNLPPSAIGDSGNFDAMGLLAANKGRPMQCIVEQVRDGSTIRVYLLPDFQFVQVFVAGIQAPSMGRRAAIETVSETETTSNGTNGDGAETRAALTSAQRLAASAAPPEVAPDPFGMEAKHFTELRTLNRDVRIVLEGVDKFNNLIGSVYYPDGESAKDLALELVENGLAKFVEWSANMMEEDAKRRLKTAELQAKKSRLRFWTNYVPPATNSKAIHDQNFTGKVVEVVSGDCVIVADDSVPFGSPLAERRVNLSSIRCPKMGNPRRDEKPAPYAREAKEFLRTRLIGRQVNVRMEYSRKMIDGPTAAPIPGDARVMDFGSIFLLSPTKGDGDEASTAPSTAGGQQPGINVAELVISRGFGTVIRHRDFEERSNFYDALLAAESRAIAGKKGIHSARDSPAMHITDLTTSSSKKAKDFLPFLHRSRRISAVVEYVLSGHRFKLLIPKETCSIAFSFSGVRCPGRDEPYSEEAIALMRRKIMQRDVEIEVETVDRTGTFLGSLWESRTNMAVTLLEAGLARFQTSFGTDRIPDAHLLEQAEQSARRQKLKIWENYVEGEEVNKGPVVESKQKEVLKVVVTEVLDGGRFYVQIVEDQKMASIQKQLASLNLQDAPVIGAFNPKRGDIVLSQFSADNSWNRAMIVNAPRGGVESPHINSWVVEIYCHKVIRLSASTQDYPNSIICNVHGVNPQFLEIGKKKIELQQSGNGNQAFTKGAYYIGKMVWSKGYKELITLLRDNQKELTGLEVDLYGSGEDSDQVQAAAKKLDLVVRVYPGRDHADPVFHDYKVFLNPSTTDVVCTTTAEALAMGKIVVCANHPSNEFFKQFPNCRTYDNSNGFVEATRKALTEEPAELTGAERHELSWEAATERFLRVADLDQVSARKPAKSHLKSFASISLNTQMEDVSAYLHHVALGFETSRRAFGAIPGSLQPDEEQCKELGLAFPAAAQGSKDPVDKS